MNDVWTSIQWVHYRYVRLKVFFEANHLHFSVFVTAQQPLAVRLSVEEIPGSGDQEESSRVSGHDRLLGAGAYCRQNVVQGCVAGLCL